MAVDRIKKVENKVDKVDRKVDALESKMAAGFDLIRKDIEPFAKFADDTIAKALGGNKNGVSIPKDVLKVVYWLAGAVAVLIGGKELLGV